MGNSLFDQLKKVGLVDEKRANQVKNEQYKGRKQQPKGKKPQIDESKKSAQQAQAAELERTRALNQKRKEKAERKEIAAQIKQIIEANRIVEREGEIAYNFMIDNKVKRAYVSEEIHKKLIAGQCGVATLKGCYEIVPKDVAEKIMQRDPRRVSLNDSVTLKKTSDENDAYAAYQVPDDLTW